MSPVVMTAPELSEEGRVAAHEAAFLRLLGLLFERPRPGRADEVRSVAGEVQDIRLQDLARMALTIGEGDYLGVFGPGGSVSPREVAYGRFVDPGRVMADLSGFYQAFAFRPRAEDPVDHIAVEVGFAGYLTLKAAYALSIGDRERADQARRARAFFLEARLRPFAAAIRARLAGAPLPHLHGAAVLLAEWAGCAPGEPADARPAVMDGAGCAALLDEADDAAMTCGGCGGEEPPASSGARLDPDSR